MVSNIRRTYKISTSLEALQAATESVTGIDMATARTPSQKDRLDAEMLALSLRRIILNGWRDRRKIASEVVDELDCFPEEAPFYEDETRMLKMGKTKCPERGDCSYAPKLRKIPNDLASLLIAIKNETRPEDVRRRRSLHTLKNTPRRVLDDRSCRDLGDAYFALHCPAQSTILTSNPKDHALLAEALGKAVTPYRWNE
jgi:hypothetical protein